MLHRIVMRAFLARQTGRAALVLSGVHRTMLTELSGSRTAAQREVERAKVLLAYACVQADKLQIHRQGACCGRGRWAA